MPDWFDSPSDLAVEITIATALFAALFWVINAKINQILHEMFPNSGKSLRDAIDRQAATTDRIEGKLDKHIDWHMNNKED